MWKTNWRFLDHGKTRVISYANLLSSNIFGKQALLNKIIRSNKKKLLGRELKNFVRTTQGCSHSMWTVKNWWVRLQPPLFRLELIGKDMCRPTNWQRIKYQRVFGLLYLKPEGKQIKTTVCCLHSYGPRWHNFSSLIKKFLIINRATWCEQKWTEFQRG